MSLTPTDKIQAARALIEPLTGYTPGPWSAHRANGEINGGESGGYPVMEINQDTYDRASASVKMDDQEWADLQLAAASPALRDTVAALADLADAQAQEISKLQAENEHLRKMLRPEWFYPADGYDGETCCFSVNEVLDEHYFWDRPKTGQHVVEINVATSLPSVWAAVRFKCECAHPDECECDNDMIVTEHASEADARAALGDAP